MGPRPVRRARAVACVVAGIVVLTGCGGSPDADVADAAGAPSPSPGGPSSAASSAADPVPSATPTDDQRSRPRSKRTTPPRSDLADLVEGIELPDGPVLGADVSWPQCPAGMGIPQKRSHGAPMPLPEAEYVVIGLTNGPGFYPNPCLADQVAWARTNDVATAAYSVVSYPRADELAEHGDEGPFDGGTDADALANVGYAQARFNLASMKAAGLVSPVVWIDVEPVPDFDWSGDVAANAAVVRGMARGYTDAGYRIGVYSTPYLWRAVVGDLSLGVPEWRAAGQTSAEEALARCEDDWVIQGGEAVLGQWVEAGRDQNLTCPGTETEMDRWFARW